MAGILKVDTIQNSNASNIVTQTNSTTITIGTSGQTVALASGATSSGFGATYNGAVNWSSTVQTTGFTAVSGTGYFVNTTSGAVTVTLPASPSYGNIVAVSDYAKTWNTNNCIIGINGSKINGVAVNYILNTQGLSITLVYIDSTKGWIVVNEGNQSAGSQPQFITATGGTVTTCGDYKIHAFTSSGCFVVTQAGSGGAPTTVDYLVVAGGGGSGYGGGGAGGFRMAPGLPVTATTYPITIGGGGVNGRAPGSPSVFSTITSAGGGGGGCFGTNPVNGGQPGGSGGGGGAQLIPQPGPGGTGNTPPVSPPQGNPGGNGATNQSSFTNGAGGGGACTAGQGPGNPSSSGPSNGGAGSPAIPIFGAAPKSFYPVPGPGNGYFSGGGGGANESPGAQGVGGIGGGGTYPTSTPTVPTPGQKNGVTNSGGGGGGGNGTGGSGIVLIKYKYQ